MAGSLDPNNQTGPGDPNYNEFINVFGTDPNNKQPPFAGGLDLGALLHILGVIPNGNTVPYAPGQQPPQGGSQQVDPNQQQQQPNWDDLLRQLQQYQQQQGGATPGASGTYGGPGNVGNPAGYGTYIPGYNPQQPLDMTELMRLAGGNPLADLQAGTVHAGGGGQHAGGGGGGANAPDASARALLNQLFTGGAQQFDPALMAQIQGLQGTSQGQYGALPGQIGGAQDPIMALIMGELANGSTAAGNFSGGYGGGGGSSLGMLSSPDISLKAISPEAQALIDQMTHANVGNLNLSRQAASGQALADLFGRGVPRSTIATDQFGRLQYGHEQALQQTLAAGNQQTLGAMLADQQARTELGKSQLGAEAQIAAANASAGASGFAASLAAQSDAARARLGLLGDIFGARSSALSSAFGAEQGANQGFADAYTRAGLGQLSAETDRGKTALGLVDSQNSLRAAMAAASASRYGADAGVRQALIGQQTTLANLPFENQLKALGFQQSEAARFQDGILKLLGIDLDKYLGDTAANAQIQSAKIGKPAQPSFLDKLIGVGGTLGAAYLGRP